jgi:DNA-binding XRE family transcriptional regulator
MEHHLDKIFRSVRKYNGFSQQDMASILNITQGTISKIEKKSMGVDAELWINFCGKFKVDPMSIYNTEHIDLLEDLWADSTQRTIGKFKIPKKYQKNQEISLRLLAPFFKFYKNKMGEKSFTSWIDSLGYDQDFFFIKNNKVNLIFFADLFDLFVKKGLGSYFSSINDNNSIEDHFDFLLNRISGNSTKKEMIKSVVDVYTNYYDSSIHCRIKSNQMFIKQDLNFPKDFVNNDLIDAKKELTLSTLSSIFFKQKISINLLYE